MRKGRANSTADINRAYKIHIGSLIARHLFKVAGTYILAGFLICSLLPVQVVKGYTE